MPPVSVVFLLCYQITMTDALKQHDTSVTTWTVLKNLIYNNLSKFVYVVYLKSLKAKQQQLSDKCREVKSK